MNPVERVIRKVDQFQQRHTVPAFTSGVIKKYGDDNGGVLVANLAYAAFISVFPLLLILVTILVRVAAGDPALLARVENAVSKQIPGIGFKLTQQIHALNQSSTLSMVVGLLLLTWGATRLAQAGLFTMEQVWNLPGPARPGYFPRLGRAAGFLGVLGAGVIVTTALASFPAFGHHPILTAALADVLAAVANIGLYVTSFRVLTPKGVPSRNLLPGAVAGGIAWTVLQAVGLIVAHHFLRTASVYGIFATVLGLLAWITLAVTMTVYAAETNVVLTRRLWPRSIVQPPLTEADRTSMALQALQNQRREEQEVQVTFSDRPEGARPAPPAPQTPQDVAPPAEPHGSRG